MIDLERLQADDRITPGDADEIRTFAAFLADAGPPPGRPGYDRARMLTALREHYPEDAAAIE